MQNFNIPLHLLPLLLLCLCPPLFGQQLPDIVIYLADDLSRSDISVYNPKGIPTPNLEQLAGEGMVFDRAFVASPSCAPSRAALLTGLMPARNGAERNHSYPQASTLKLTTLLQDLGYEVLSFGKIAHGGKRELIEPYGFDYIEPKPTGLPDLVKAYFDKRKSEQPVCLMVGDRRPHVRWTTEMDFDPAELDLPPFLLDTPETRAHWARYATDIKGMDEDLGLIRQYAREWFGEDHIFLFSGDHGSQWPFGKWNLYDYGIRVPFLISWPERIAAGSQTDAMISWVDIFPTLIDLVGGQYPDTLDGRSFRNILAEPQQTHREMIFTTHNEDGQFNVYPIRSVRGERYKYIINLMPANYHSNHSDINRFDGAGAYWDSWDATEKSNPIAADLIHRYFVRPQEELYDLATDPMEQHNLAGQPAYEELLAEMRAQLNVWMEAQQDSQKVKGTPYPVSGPRPSQAMVREHRE
ncbi:sulfatase family protein [Flavilitoribacter nigricans]|uniref:Arylsulfatase n=1 Tax=Flavilitoribacter nigricans (strain ATCC 23147 / DSM 23189 / NBRC 102662 / NCIMB 1420 / SS-2) TaxID=1122177 RepID=A0A2D0N5G8_FLAN2|nr:sulfatase [Flavilitoribacter nigricans]PHN03638.1 arylsulfatase [Flavilitoribacter nigricans DSM 23189 = NBRC 102662]